MTKTELSNLLKTWNTKELHKTLISYGIRFRKYQSKEKDNIYYGMQEMITLLNAEIDSRR